MKLQSQDQIIEVSEVQALKLKRRGWAEVKDSAGEDIIRLKPPVKSKATERALEEAKNVKGDE